MNKKKLLAMALAVGIAGMLMTAQSSDALVPLIVGGIALFVGGAIVGWKLAEHFDKNDEDLPTSNLYNRENYRTVMLAQMDTWHNQLLSAKYHAIDMLNLYNNTFLYFSRHAENEVCKWINTTNWGDAAPHIIKYYENTTNDMLKSIAHVYEMVNLDIEHELNNAKELDFVTVKLWGNDISDYTIDFSVNALNYDHPTELPDNHSITETDVFLNFSFYDNGTIKKDYSHGFAIGGAATTPIEWIYYFRPKGSGIITFGHDKDYTGTITVEISGVDPAAWNMGTGEYLSWTQDLYNLTYWMAQGILNNAKLIWDYCHEQGWEDVSDIPESWIPIYPDFVFDNWEMLKDIDLNDTKLIYYSMLEQIKGFMGEIINESQNISDTFHEFSGSNETDTIPYENITQQDWIDIEWLDNSQWSNVTDPNSDGGHDITWNEWKSAVTQGYGDVDAGDIYFSENSIIINATIIKHVDGSNTTLVDKGRLIPIPLQEDLTLESGWTYYFSQTMNASQYHIINQTVIFVEEIKGNTYRCIPLTGNDYYKLIVHALWHGDTLHKNFTWDHTTLNDFTHDEWGFKLSTFSEDWQTPPAGNGDGSGSLGNFLEKYKAWIVAGCIVTGGILLLSATNKKSDQWKRTLGALLLVVGVIAGLYYYVYVPLTEDVGGIWNTLTGWL